jgi:hypothetical protein
MVDIRENSGPRLILPFIHFCGTQQSSVHGSNHHVSRRARAFASVRWGVGERLLMCVCWIGFPFDLWSAVRRHQILQQMATQHSSTINRSCMDDGGEQLDSGWKE